MSDEEAKAIQEIAKTTGKVADLVKSTGEGISDIFGESFRQFGGVVADWATYYRQKNWLRIADKVDDLLAARRLEGKRVPLATMFALPIIEAASLEADEDVQLLWAGLIANAVDPGQGLRLKKIFVEILRGMQALDALIVKTLAESDVESVHGLVTGSPLNANVVASRVKADLNDVQISLQTLARYGCVIDSWENTIAGMDSGYAGFRVDNPRSNFRLSHLGHQLVRATAPDGNADR